MINNCDDNNDNNHNYNNNFSGNDSNNDNDENFVRRFKNNTKMICLQIISTRHVGPSHPSVHLKWKSTFVDDVFMCIVLTKIVLFWLKSQLSLFSRVQSTIFSLYSGTGIRRNRRKDIPERMYTNSPMYGCITRPKGVNPSCDKLFWKIYGGICVA